MVLCRCPNPYSTEQLPKPYKVNNSHDFMSDANVTEAFATVLATLTLGFGCIGLGPLGFGFRV